MTHLELALFSLPFLLSSFSIFGFSLSCSLNQLHTRKLRRRSHILENGFFNITLHSVYFFFKIYYLCQELILCKIKNTGDTTVKNKIKNVNKISSYIHISLIFFTVQTTKHFSSKFIAVLSIQFNILSLISLDKTNLQKEKNMKRRPT